MQTSRNPSPAYHQLKRKIAERAHGRCEFCSMRAGNQLHHRWYLPSSFTGLEPEESVMLVCRLCHRLIHGHIRSVVAADNSLATWRDRGLGSTLAWRRYLDKLAG
jgi:hypothetical protein